ncbi:MAG: hypothetical protein IJG51_11905 [Synergistaceae bacterium]|nr:hypothetical protein [Synergistaceae bacterium]MBQ6665899.1 hypothetical protein [Synergistaceae bacterium]
MTDKIEAIAKLKFALELYRYEVRHAEEIAAEGKRDMRNCFRLVAFRNVSIITDNAFSRKQFEAMLDAHLDEIISFTE